MRVEFFRKIYDYVLWGLIGGLGSALVYQILISNYFSKELMGKTVFENKLSLGILGATFGALLGFFPNFLEGKKRASIKVALIDGFKGASLCFILGAIIFPISEFFHIFLKKYFVNWEGDMLSRVVALAVLGISIGAGIGLALSINGGTKWGHALLGGLVGGAISGLVVELILSWLKQALIPDDVQMISIIAFLIIGAVTLFFIAIFIVSLSNAYLIGLKGSKFSGQSYPLSKFLFPEKAFIGSSPKSYIQILDAEETHASIWLTKRYAVIKHLAKVGKTLVNGTPLVDEVELVGDEIITIGKVEFQYVKNVTLADKKEPAINKRIKILS